MSLTFTREQLEQLVQDRMASTTQQLTEYQNKFKKQQKQIDDLKFFQEVDGNANNNNNKSQNNNSQNNQNNQKMEAKNKQMKETEDELNAIKTHLHKTLTENSHLSQQITQLKHQNIDLQANLQACNPPMSSPDAYKKALRLQSDLLDAKNVLQEEILARERAETNLQCLKMESESQIQDKDLNIGQLEMALQKREKDLDDGLTIMKSLEEEIQTVQRKFHEEHVLNQEMAEKFEAFEKEKNALADTLMEELEASKDKLTKLETRFDREKGELEDNCDELRQ